MRNAIFGGALIVLCGATQAICLNPFGCGPSNYEECVAEATTRPTELGVRLARSQCHDKFLKPEADRIQRESAEKAEAFAARWQARAGEISNLKQANTKIGKPDSVTGPEACARIKGEITLKHTQCFTHRWEDRRASRICWQTSGVERCHFQIQTIENAEQALWAVWPESF